MDVRKYIIEHFAKGSERSIQVKKNIAASIFIKGINVLISLLLIPLTIGYVNNQLYGIWLTLSTIIAWISFFDIGIGNGLRNKIAESIAKNNVKHAKILISTGYIYITLIFSALALILYFIIPFVNWCSLLNINNVYQQTVISVMRIITVGFCITMILKVQSNVLMALQMNALANLFDTLGQILVLSSTFILTITTKPSLVYLSMAVTFSPVVVYILSTIWLFLFKYKELCPSIKLADSKYIKEILGLGIKFFLIQINAIIFYQTINVIISNVSGPAIVTEYNVIYKYFGCASMLLGILLAPLWSAYTDAHTRQDYQWMRNIYHKLNLALLGCSLIVLIMIILYPFAFRLWLGNKVEIHLAMILSIAAYTIIGMWQSINTTIQNGTGKVLLQMLYSTFFAIIYIPLALFVGHLCGSEGVILFLSIVGVFWLIVQHIQVKKILNNTARGIWAK